MTGIAPVRPDDLSTPPQGPTDPGEALRQMLRQLGGQPTPQLATPATSGADPMDSLRAMAQRLGPGAPTGPSVGDIDLRTATGTPATPPVRSSRDVMATFFNAPSVTSGGSFAVKIPELTQPNGLPQLAHRNNNPGNLAFAGQPNAVQGDSGFARFKTPEDGYRALLSQIATDTGRGHTLSSFISKYAPPNENDTASYIADVAGALGTTPDAPLASLDRDALARAMIRRESQAEVIPGTQQQQQATPQTTAQRPTPRTRGLLATLPTAADATRVGPTPSAGYQPGTLERIATFPLAMAFSAAQHPVDFAMAPIKAAITANRASAEQDAANAIAQAGGDPSVVERTVTPKEATIAGAQVFATLLAPEISGRVASLTEGLLGSAGSRLAGHMIGAGSAGAAFDPSDPVVGFFGASLMALPTPEAAAAAKRAVDAGRGKVAELVQAARDADAAAKAQGTADARQQFNGIVARTLSTMSAKDLRHVQNDPVLGPLSRDVLQQMGVAETKAPDVPQGLLGTTPQTEPDQPLAGLLRPQTATPTPTPVAPPAAIPAPLAAMKDLIPTPSPSVPAADAMRELARQVVDPTTRPPIASVRGAETRVLLRDGQTLPAQYRIVSADALQSSHDPFSFTPNPNYPEGVQGRDYQRNKAAQSVVSQRALSFNPDIALNPSESAGEGAPTILPDGTVLAGNERSMLPRRAAVQAPDRYREYVDQLKARAQSFGLDPASVDATRNPMLVRVLTDPRDVQGGVSRWAEINRLSDEVGTKAKSGAEEGAARAAKLANATDSMTHLADTLQPDQTVTAYLGTPDGREFVRRLTQDGVLTPDELSRLTDTSGTLTEDGRLAVRRMLLSTAVTDPAAMLDAPQSVVNKLEHAVPSIVATRGTKFATAKLTTEALKMLAEARDNGVTVRDLAAQGGLFGDTRRSPNVTALATFLDEAKAGDVKNAYRRYATLAREAMGNAESSDMFGGTGFDTPAKAFREAFGFRDTAMNEEPLASPKRKPTVSQGTGDFNLFGEEVKQEVPAQGGLFGEDVGTRAQQTDAEKLKKWAEAISPEEMARRRDELGAERSSEPPAGPDQEALFSPAASNTPIGSKIRSALGMSAKQSAAVVDRVQSLGRISRTLAEIVGVPLRQGRFLASQRRALGAFFVKAEVARILRYDHIETAAHEIGHYISKEYLQNPTQQGAPGRGAIPLPKAARFELVKMGKDLYGARQPAGGYGEEGIAQWSSFYVTDPARMAAEAPAFSAWMDKNVFPGERALKAALDQARKDFSDYSKAPAAARVAAMIAVKPERRLMPNTRKLATAMLDDLSEIQKAVTDIGAAKSPDQDAYIIARLTRGAAGAAEEMIDRGVADPRTGKRLAPGYATILRQLKPEDVQDFRTYLVAERTLEVAKRGINTGITVKDAQAVVQQFAPKFRAQAEQVWKISNALIDYREARGLLTPQEAAFIKERNQRRVGLYRAFGEDETATARGSGAGFARNSSGVLSMKGSAREIVDPLATMIADHYNAVTQGDRAEVMRTLYQHAQRTEGSGAVVERLTEVPKRPVNIPIERVQSQLADLGFDPEAIKDAAEAGAVLSSFENLNVAGSAEAKDLVTPVVVNGKRVWLQIGDRPLYDALKGLGTEQLPTWLRVLSFPTRTLRAGATLTTEFIARNPVRDAFTAAVFTRAGIPAPGFDLARGLFHALKRDDLYQAWRLSGGDNAAMLGLDRMGTHHALRDYLRSPAARAAGWVLNPIDALRAASSLMENATRIGEFAAVRKQALGRGAGLRAANTEAAFAARDITVDFARAGTQGRIVNQLVAFFNANVQGVNKLGRELAERPHVVVPRLVALITVPSVALYLSQRDDPAYQEIPAWQKALAWIIVQRGPDGKVAHIWRIPKPPELGILFGSVPEQLLEWTRLHDPNALRAMADGLTNLNPLHIPDALSPIIAAWANKDPFTGRAIVPQGVTALPGAEQSTTYTGEMARTIGNLTDFSPAKIEALVRGYFGGIGTYGLQASDAAVRAERSARGLPPMTRPLTTGADQLAQTPLARGFAVRTPGMESESIVRTLSDFDRADAHRQAWRRMLERGDPGASDYLARHRADIQSVATAEEAGTPGPLRQEAMALRQAQSINAKAVRTQLGNQQVQDIRQTMTEKARDIARMHTGLGPYTETHESALSAMRRLAAQLIP